MYRVSKKSLSLRTCRRRRVFYIQTSFLSKKQPSDIAWGKEILFPYLPQAAVYCMPPKWHAGTLSDKPRRIGADLNVEEKAISATVATSTGSHSNKQTPPPPAALGSRLRRLVKATSECGYMVIEPYNIALVSKQPQTYGHALHGLLRRARCKT